MSKPSFFSVIIPLYNKENHIKKTIESVINQTFTEFEIIIINDGSTDESLRMVEAIHNKKIKVYTTKNEGVSAARNFGIKKATSNLIAFLDADDIWYNHHLEDLKNLYERYPNCGMYCKAYSRQFANNLIKSNYKNVPKETNWMGIIDNYFESSLINCIAWTSAVAIPKHILSSLNNFDTTITMGAGEDIDLWLRIALKHPVAFYNKISAIHNLNAENRLSKLNINSRRFIDLDQYEIFTQENKSLKTYLDINRFAIAIQYKLVGNSAKANEYIGKIHASSLNKKQRILFKLNKNTLKTILKIKNYLRKANINFNLYN